MIDFSNTAFIKMTPVSSKIFGHQVTPILIPGEEIVASFQAIRDGVVFTNKRIIAINIQQVFITGMHFHRIRRRYGLDSL